MKTIIAHYMGRRLTTKGKLAHFWKFGGEQNPRAFDKQLAPAMIGEPWVLTFTPDDAIYIRGEHAPVRADLQNGKADQEQARTWAALEAADAQRAEEERGRRQLAKRQGEFDRAIEPLRAMLATLRTHNDRAAFIQKVQAELWRK